MRPFKCWITILVLLLSTGLFTKMYCLDTLDKALEESILTGKHILIEYTAQWCLPCQIFEEGTLSNPSVSQLLESDFIFIKADYDASEFKDLFDHFGVACMPTLHILNMDGEIELELSGNVSSSQFYNALLPFVRSNTLKDPVISKIINASTENDETVNTHFLHKNNEELTTEISSENYSIDTFIKDNPTSKNVVDAEGKQVLTLVENDKRTTQLELQFKDESSPPAQISDVHKVKEIYVLQAGAFASLKNAQRQKEKILGILEDIVEIELNSKNQLYTVSLGPFEEMEDMEIIKKKLKQTGIDHFVKRKRV